MQNLYVLNFKWFAQKETSNSTRSQACRLSNKSIDFLTLLFVYLAEAPTGVSWVPPESHLNQRLGHRSAIYWLGRGSGEVPNAWNTDTCLFVSSLILRLFNVTRQDLNSDYCSLSWTHFVPLNGAAYSLFTRILFWGYAHALSLSGLDSVGCVNILAPGSMPGNSFKPRWLGKKTELTRGIRPVLWCKPSAHTVSIPIILFLHSISSPTPPFWQGLSPEGWGRWS